MDVKRTPLTRRSPLKPGKATLARSRMRRVGKRKERELDAIKAFSKAVRARAGGLCERCGGPGDHAHHLVPRGRSGGGPGAHNPAFGRYVCRRCHDDIHCGRAEPGWIFSSHEQARRHADAQ